MPKKRKVEIFSANCRLCTDAIELIRQMTCPSCEVTILNVNDRQVANRAKQLGIRCVPAVVIDGSLAECCKGAGIDVETLRRQRLGSQLS